MGDLMAQALQFLGQLAYTLARPAQGRFWVSPRHWLDQSFQILAQARIFADVTLASASFSPDSPLAHLGPLLQFLDPLADDPPGKPGRSRDHRNPSPPDRQRLAGCQQSPRPFIQFCRDSLVSLLDLFFSVHVS